MKQQKLLEFFHMNGSRKYAPERNRRHADHPKNENTLVWEDTVSAFSNNGRFSHITRPDKSQVIRYIPKSVVFTPRFTDTSVVVENQCTLDMVHVMRLNNYNPLVLNMASDWIPGGGVRKGSRAQEEDLFRKSNYHLTLDTRKITAGTYPMKGFTMVYSSNVTVVKDSNYQDLEKPFTTSFIACAAVRNPECKNVHGNPDYANEYDRATMANRIERLYQIAYAKGHDSIVLGALGCGAFHNPVHSVAAMFKQMNKRYEKCFRRIAFPVLSGNGNENYNVFKSVLLEDPK